MSKDMTNIDELFKHKLSEHQVQGDEDAAWLKMKALLDEKMPERGIFYFKWKKPVLLLGAALLLAALCAGTYEIFWASRDSKQGDIAKISNSNSDLGIFVSPDNDKAIDNQLEKVDDVIGKAKEYNNNTHLDNNSERLASTADQNKKALHSNHTRVSDNENIERGSQPKQNALVASNNPKETKHADNIEVEHKQPAHATATNHHQATPIPLSADNINSVKVNSPNKSNRKANLTDITSSISENRSSKQLNNQTIANSSIGNTEQLASNNSKKSSELTTDPIVSQEKASTKKDTIPSITVVTKESVTKTFPRQKQLVLDTVSKGNVVLAQNVVQTNNVSSASTPSDTKSPSIKGQTTRADKELGLKQSNATLNNGALNKQVPEKAPEKSESASTQTKATDKKNKKSSWLSNIKLSEKINTAKKDVANADFFAGFNVGFNQSIGNTNNFLGVQFGPTGELVFNQHWSLFGALKYFNRSGGTKTVNDSYIKESAGANPDSIIGANRYYTVFTDSTNRFFNFSTLHSFELPITLRYAFQKFYLMTGINIAYYLGVNVEEVQKNYAQVRSHSVTTNLTKPILLDNAPQIRASDFGSKLGLGYILGFGYRISPAWHTDLRIANTFWDNASGDGAKKLSKDFYRIPSVQISVGYQFNRGKTKPTFGPTDIR